jgi:UDP-glucose 4-epimerase
MTLFYNKKQVLVTGGAGVIGTELIKLLKTEGAIIRCVDIVEKPQGFPDVEYFQMDISQESNQFLFRFEPEIVFHLAADFERSEESEFFWESNFQNNVLASHNLIRKAITCPSLKKVIFASSYLIYDKTLYTETTNTNPISETSRINPRNLCGIAKLQTERDIEFFASVKHFSYACARIFRVYGKGSRDIISRWIRNIIVRNSIDVFSENNQFDYIYARDVAEGLEKLGQAEEQGIFNLGTGRATSIKKVVEILKKIQPETTINYLDKKIWDESSCADICKLQSVTKWKPPTTIESGIKEIYDFEKKRNLYARNHQNQG